MAVENTHTENLVDNDRKFRIDPQTRTIKNASYDKELVQYDSSSEVFTFEMPRYVEGHDMGAAKNVKVYYVNKGASEEIVDSTDVTSTLKIADDGTNTAVFSWTIPANATQHEGTLDFAVTFTCPEVSPDYIWSTKIYSGIVINKGLRNSSEIIKRDPDAFDAILTRVSEAENKVNEVDDRVTEFRSEMETFKNTLNTISDQVANISENANCLNIHFKHEGESSGFKIVSADDSNYGPISLKNPSNKDDYSLLITRINNRYECGGSIRIYIDDEYYFDVRPYCVNDQGMDLVALDLMYEDNKQGNIMITSASYVHVILSKTDALITYIEM